MSPERPILGAVILRIQGNIPIYRILGVDSNLNWGYTWHEYAQNPTPKRIQCPRIRALACRGFWHWSSLADHHQDDYPSYHGSPRRRRHLLRDQLALNIQCRGIGYPLIFGAMELWETSVVILSHYSAYNHPSTVRISHIEPLNGLSPPPIESIRLVIVVLPFWRSIRPLFWSNIRACEAPIRG